MKRVCLFFLILVVPLSLYAQRSRGGGDWQLSASVGANVASMDSEMQAGATNLEDYSGRVGAESHFSVKVGRIETSYILQYYYAKKDDKVLIGAVEYDEVGDVDFYNELFDISYYIIDEPILTGFTFNVGIGKGTSKIVVERSLDGVDLGEEKMYGKVLHYFGAIHYEILDWLFAKVTYRNLNINTVDQPNFSNSTFTANVGVKF